MTITLEVKKKRGFHPLLRPGSKNKGWLNPEKEDRVLTC